MQPTLRRTIGRFQYFALGFGTIVGSAWVVVLGEWLQVAGPGGAVIGFLAGGIFMCLIAAVYAELCARMPEAGGEFVFAYRLFGPKVGFFVGWFVTLYLIAIAAFEAIVLPWLLQTLWPGLRQAVLYEFLGESVTLDAAVIGLAGVVLVTFLNYRDVRLAVMFQSAITYGFVIVALLVLAAGAASGAATNLQPLFDAGSGEAWWLGALWIFANTAFFLNGFQAIPQAIEERAEGTSTATVARVMIGCVAAGASFYCVVVIFASLSTPWQALAGAPLASAAAVSGVVPGGLLTTVLLLVAAFSLLKTWNAIAFMAAPHGSGQAIAVARAVRTYPSSICNAGDCSSVRRVVHSRRTVPRPRRSVATRQHGVHLSGLHLRSGLCRALEIAAPRAGQGADVQRARRARDVGRWRRRRFGDVLHRVDRAVGSRAWSSSGVGAHRLLGCAGLASDASPASGGPERGTVQMKMNR